MPPSDQGDAGNPYGRRNPWGGMSRGGTPITVGRLPKPAAPPVRPAPKSLLVSSLKPDPGPQARPQTPAGVRPAPSGLLTAAPRAEPPAGGMYFGSAQPDRPAPRRPSGPRVAAAPIAVELVPQAPRAPLPRPTPTPEPAAPAPDLGLARFTEPGRARGGTALRVGLVGGGVAIVAAALAAFLWLGRANSPPTASPSPAPVLAAAPAPLAPVVAASQPAVAQPTPPAVAPPDTQPQIVVARAAPLTRRPATTQPRSGPTAAPPLAAPATTPPPAPVVLPPATVSPTPAEPQPPAPKPVVVSPPADPNAPMTTKPTDYQ